MAPPILANCPPSGNAKERTCPRNWLHKCYLRRRCNQYQKVILSSLLFLLFPSFASVFVSAFAIDIRTCLSKHPILTRLRSLPANTSGSWCRYVCPFSCICTCITFIKGDQECHSMKNAQEQENKIVIGV